MKRVISLFDLTGNIVKPWLSEGYDCWIVDIQHPNGWDTERETLRDDGVHLINWDLSSPWLPPFSRSEIAFVAAFPPCDHIAVSGRGWFKGKGLRLLAQSMQFFATCAEFCEWSGAPYLIENPRSVVSSHWRPSDYQFHPWEFSSHFSGDIHQKETHLWTGGGFIMPKKKTELTGPVESSWVNNTSGKGQLRKNRRSSTPLGFSRAVFEANSRFSI